MLWIFRGSQTQRVHSGELDGFHGDDTVIWQDVKLIWNQKDNDMSDKNIRPIIKYGCYFIMVHTVSTSYGNIS